MAFRKFGYAGRRTRDRSRLRFSVDTFITGGEKLGKRCESAVRGGGRAESDERAGIRVTERERFGKKRERRPHTATVLPVSDDWMPVRRQLTADLMETSRFESHGKK